MKSIIQSGHYCFVSGVKNNLNKHHCLTGGLRNFAEKEGLWVYLSSFEHYKLHNNSMFEKELKMIAQYFYENKYSHDLWMKNVRKNYLDSSIDKILKKYNLNYEVYVIEV